MPAVKYRSSIPKAARERVMACWVESRVPHMAEYRLGAERAGVRWYDETGALTAEIPLKNGVRHGAVLHFDPPGVLKFAEPYRNGVPHGTARQYDEEGRLLGTYTMRNGTGRDVWRQRRRNGTVYVSEVRHYREGKWHGFEWWLGSDRTAWEERHFWRNELHGIERVWNKRGRLRRGYPQYWIHNVRATKRQYVKAAAADATLPPFTERDNRPRRRFPPEIAALLT